MHEQEFRKGDCSVEFAAMEILQPSLGVPVSDRTRQEMDGAAFLLPTAQQFPAIYRASSQDSYRNENNNHKDFTKIE